MRHVLAAAAVVAGLTVAYGLAGCAGSNGSGSDPRAGSSSAAEAAFDERAEVVARAWREGTASGAWTTGFVPLADLTVPPRGGFADDGGKQAFMAGWYALRAPLPDGVPAAGTVRFPDGSSLSVPLVGARDAYAALDQGDPPCPSGTPVPAPAVTGSSNPGPDQATSTQVPHTCAVLTVTGVTLGETSLRTSRGEAKVPAWLFTIAGLGEPVARVAVASSAVHPVPAPSLPAAPIVTGSVTAQDIESVAGTTLVYRLGVGACDYDIRPLLYETPEVVVVGGAVRTRSGACPDLLKLQPVTVTLTQPLGARPVVDAITGRALASR